MDKLIEVLREEYRIIEKEQGLGEENIKINLVREVFLRELGYDVKKATYEQNVANGATDIRINVGDEILTVETKSGDHKIVYKDIEQLIRYLNTQGREWGILTNGKDYVLLNSKIETAVSENHEAHYSNIVFWFDIFVARSVDKNELKYFSCLSKRSIFETKTTHFFKDIAQYKVYKFRQDDKSWRTYKSTLYSFFDFYVEELGKTYRDRALEKVLVEDFEEYIRFKSKKVSLSEDTVRNNWSHINSMLLTFKERGRIGYNPFEAGRNACLGKGKSEKQKNVNNLTEQNVALVLGFYASRDNVARNMAGFLLCSILGFERSDVIVMKWEDIELDKGIVHHGIRSLKCPKLLLDCLTIMHKEKVRNKNKIDYVFCTYKKGKFYPFNEATLNDIFNRLENIDKEDSKWKDFSPKYVKNCSIQVYFEYGYSIDEILYWTGCDFGQISEFLKVEEIFKRIENAKKTKKRTEIFAELLDTCVNDWKK